MESTNKYNLIKKVYVQLAMVLNANQVQHQLNVWVVLAEVQLITDKDQWQYKWHVQNAEGGVLQLNHHVSLAKVVALEIKKSLKLFKCPEELLLAKI